MLDTGATLSVISFDTIMFFGLRSHMRATSEILRGPSGEKLNSIGEIQISFKITNIPNKVFTLHFIVIRDLQFCVLLGLEFIRKYKLGMEFDNNTLRHGNASSPFYFLSTPPRLKEEHHTLSISRVNTLQYPSMIGKQKCPLKIAKGTVIDPFSQGWVKIIIPEKFMGRSMDFTPAKTCQGILFGKLSVYEGKIQIYNYNNFEFFLKENITIGFLFHIKGEHMNATVFPTNPQKVSNTEAPWYTKLKFGELDDEIKNRLLKFLIFNEKVFAKSLNDLGATDILQHEIKTKDNLPVAKRPYRLEHSKRESMSKIIEELLAANIIEESTSPYSAPALLVRKQDGSDRLVIDYRALNEKIVQSNTFNLNVNDVFDFLHGKNFFSTLDLKSGYYQINMAREDKSKTAFSTHENHYHFLKCPMGLKNAPSTFQRLMIKVLGKLQFKSVAVFLDDILIASETLESHFNDLENVFNCLKQANLKLHPSKCFFLKKEIKFLGYIIDERGLRPDPSKIETVKTYPTPTSRRDVKAFLGLTGFYRRFIKDFSAISLPLFELTKLNKPFTWSARANEAFENLKIKLLSPPILRHPNLNKDFIIFSDSSGFSVGCTLAQKDDNNQTYAIAYASRKLNNHEIHYDIFNKELTGVVFALKQFHTYVFGRTSSLVVDNRALVYLKNMKEPNARQLRIILKLQQYDMNIIHKPGTSNVVADAFSRIKYKNEDENVDNEILNFLENKQPAIEKINFWKKQICGELGLTISNSINTNTIFATSDPDNFFKQISFWLSGSEDSHQLIRQFIHSFELSKKKYFDRAFIKKDLTISQHLRALKKNGAATVTELQAVACIFKIPILEEFEKSEKVYLPSTDSFIKSIPPEGLFLRVERSKEDIFTFSFPDLGKTNTVAVIKNNEKIVVEMPEIKDIVNLQKKDDFCAKWLDFLKTGNCTNISKNSINFYKTKLSINEHNILSFKDKRKKIRIVLPESLIGEVLKASHKLKSGGHLGRERTWKMVENTCYRPGLRNIVNNYVKNCTLCMNKKARSKIQEVEATEIKTANFPFQDISIDILGPLPKTPRGNKYLLVIVDRFSKWTEALPLPDTSTQMIAEKLIGEIFCRFGIPETLLCDNATYFESKLFDEIMTQFGIKKRLIPTYTARANSQVERYNLTIINSLKCFTDEDKTHWDISINYTLLAMRNSVCVSTAETPSFVLFGRQLKLPLDLIFHKDLNIERKDPSDYAKSLFNNMRDLDRKIKLINTEQRRKYLSYANKTRAPTTLKVGDLVMIHTPALRKGQSKKLTNLMKGPARIIEKLGRTCFHVKTLGGKVMKRVHANRLRSFDPTIEEHFTRPWCAELSESEEE